MLKMAIPLGILGLVPLIVFAIGAVGQVPVPAERMLISLIDYAALILAFAGGVHWGLALAPGAERPGLRVAAGGLPLIVSWIGLVISQIADPTLALVALIVGYLLTVLTEHRAAKRLMVPTRYVWVRWGFSIVAMIVMVLVLVLRSFGQTIVFQ